MTYLSPFNVFYFTDVSFALRYTLNLLISFWSVKDLVWSNLLQGTWLLWLILPIFAFVNLILYFRKRLNYLTTSLIASLMLTFLYSTVTISNMMLNPINSQLMRNQDRFKNTVIGQGPNIYLYDEYMSILPYAMEISKFLKDRELFDFQKKLLVDFVSKSKSEVVSDPKLRLRFDSKDNWLPSAQDPSVFSLAPTLDYEQPSLFTADLFRLILSN